MTKLMVWAALAGAVIGLVFLGAEGIARTAGDGTDVVYEGSYEPLRGADDQQTLDELNEAFWDGLKWWNQLILP